MGDLSTNFSRREFACKCGCGHDTVDAELLTVLQWLRWEVKARIDINSGCRCRKHNRNENGKKRSQHLFGRAADIVVDDVRPAQVFDLLEEQYPARLGLICYDRFVHVDSRRGKYRERK